SGRAHTGFQIEARPPVNEALDRIFAGVAFAYMQRTEHVQRRILPSIPLRFRNNPYPAPAARFEVDGRPYQLGSDCRRSEILAIGKESIDALIDGVRHRFYIHRVQDTFYVRSDLGQRTVLRLPRYPRAAGATRQAANSPMPGQVLRVAISP